MTATSNQSVGSKIFSCLSHQVRRIPDFLAVKCCGKAIAGSAGTIEWLIKKTKRSRVLAQHIVFSYGAIPLKLTFFFVLISGNFF